MPTVQYCSNPRLHSGQVRQESTKQPTPTLSPTLYFVTLFPTAVTTPAISCPGTMGKIEARAEIHPTHRASGEYRSGKFRKI